MYLFFPCLFYRQVFCVLCRAVEETPIFKTSPTATLAGQYEASQWQATFQPDSSTIMRVAPQASSLGLLERNASSRRFFQCSDY